MWRQATEAETQAWLESGTPPGKRFRLVPGLGLTVEDDSDDD